ncbi:MAG TPA: 4-alpha-glucanotransferase [Burkholderiales bacterium]|nr:4-alpha-glucanotransferase [Burkholderiales bacterium]
MRDALVHLASLYGIASDYYDIWGKQHQVSDASLSALLGTMGVAANSPDTIEAAIQNCEAQRWKNLIPPVVVARAHKRPWLLRLNLPPLLDNATLSWRIEQEDGVRHGADIRPADLHCPESRIADGEPRIGREWSLDINLPLGYHLLYLSHEGRDVGRCLLVVAPPTCFQPPRLREGGRIWGSVVQLYSLRSERNWGIGDYADLALLVEQWGVRGAGIVGVNPLHALFPHNPAHSSPYSPSSRLFKNVLYLALDLIEDYSECAHTQAHVQSEGFQTQLRQLRESELVDYARVGATKFAVLEKLYASFREKHLEVEDDRADDFRAFQKEGGENLRRHALFEALQAHFHSRDPSAWGWPVWPEDYRDPESVAVRQFAEAQVERIEFYEYLQWQADLQLAAVCERAHDAGLSVGLYEDLAVSIDRGGAESWANQDLYAIDASVGAPPDEFNLQGQNWGLPPLIPARLHAAAYAPFIATLRATMRHAGALRIDHVMGLARLFWAPPGQDASHGGYVHYPFDDLLGILALESHRHRCLVIGEDLGTVPDEVRSALLEHVVLSYRLLYFERREDGSFKSPNEYPAVAIVSATTHDLPTLAGWWEGSDIDLRLSLHLFPDAAMAESQRQSRDADRRKLLEALAREGLLPVQFSTDPADTPRMTPELAQAIAAYLGATPAKVEVIQMEDVLEMREQANMPGTTHEHPNWQRKLTLGLEHLAADERFIRLTQELQAARGPS